MSRIDESKRRFLRTIGFGAGARVLAPIATLLHGTAYGAVPVTKKVVFISLSAGLPDVQLGVGSRRSETDWDYHPALAALAPWKSKTAIVSGLHLNIPGSQHTGGYGLLACTRTEGAADNYGAPTAATIDHLLGRTLSPNATVPTLLFGIDRDPTRFVHQSLFASGPNQPTPYPVRASTMFERLFPNSAAAQASTADNARVMGRLRSDINTLRSKLAGEERGKLDQYLSSIDALDRRRANASCATSMSGVGPERGIVAELPTMLEMAITALSCGMTNVVGCALGGGNSHWHFPTFVGPHIGTRFEEQGYVSEHGHDERPWAYQEGRTVVWKWLSEQVASFLRQLDTVGADGRRLSDDTTVVLFSDSGPDHHNGNSWRFIVIGGESVKTGGRFIICPEDTSWSDPTPGGRSVNSFVTALATGLGAPMQTFGSVGPGRTAAPMPELLR